MPPFHQQQYADDEASDSEESLQIRDSLALYPKEHELAIVEDLEATEVSSTCSDNDTIATTEQHQQQLVTPRRTVHFGPVQVREYNRAVGDHPDVKYGPPIGIGWDYHEVAIRTLDEHEVIRKETRKGLRRLTSLTRRNMLRNTVGVSEDEIQQAEQEVARISQQREESKKQSKVRAKTQDMFKTMKRKMFGRGGSNMFQGLSAVAAAGSMGIMSMGMGGMGMSY